MRLKDKNGSLMMFRTNNQGAILTKGKRDIYLLFQTVNQGEKARKAVADFSFNQLFNKGRKSKIFGSNVSYIKFK